MLTREGYMVAGFVALGALFVGLVIAAAIADENAWTEYVKEHDCKVVGRMSGSSSTAVGIGTNGTVSVVPVYTPGKTGWACDDGVTYWR